MIVILMGVTGSGKSTVGKLLARRLGWTFLEGDDFHPAANVDKMRRGIPLNDADRLPWLQAIRREIANQVSRHESAIIACSALKERYRRILETAGDVKFVYLRATLPLIQARLKKRSHHFMKPTLISSQFHALEEPRTTVEVDAALPASEIVKMIRRALDI